MWSQKKHAKSWLLFPENIGPYLCIDETALSKGELYTIITNKRAKGKKGAIVGMFSGTKVEPIVEQLLKLPYSQRVKVKEITLDMANSMKIIAKKCFPKAIQVTDRFHVQKLTLEALQDIRIKHRWEAIDLENEQEQKTKPLFQSSLAMVTQGNNYWQGAGICCIKPLVTGLKTNPSEVRFYSSNILI